MKFLDTVVIARKTASNLNTDNAELVTEAIELNITLTGNDSDTSCTKKSQNFVSPSPINSVPLPSTSSVASSLTSFSSGSRQFSSRKSHRGEKINSTVNAIVASAKTIEADDVFTLFGKTITLNLRQLTLLEATMAMSDMHQYITQKPLSILTASENAADPLEEVMVDADIIKLSYAI